MHRKDFILNSLLKCESQLEHSICFPHFESSSRRTTSPFHLTKDVYNVGDKCLAGSPKNFMNLNKKMLLRLSPPRPRHQAQEDSPSAAHLGLGGKIRADDPHRHLPFMDDDDGPDDRKAEKEFQVIFASIFDFTTTHFGGPFAPLVLPYLLCDCRGRLSCRQMELHYIYIYISI